MGCDIRAFVQIDDNSSPSAPWENDPSTWDLSADIGLSVAKDYRLYAALAGIRNETDLSPLFPPRGLPRHYKTDGIADLFDYLGVSWLTLPEIEQAMLHMKVNPESLSKSATMLLDVMRLIDRHLGAGRCRLVFGFSD
jgi:hypothetical protein